MMAFMCFGNTHLLFRYKMIKTPLTFTELRCYKIKNKFDSNRFGHRATIFIDFKMCN